jgi:type I pantothenate kinase
VSDRDPRRGFTVWERPAWAGLGRGRGPVGVGPSGVMSQAEWDEVYVPLAHLIGIHRDNRLGLAAHLRAAGLSGAAGGPFVIGLGGAVAVGKSTAAIALSALIGAQRDRPRVAVLSTDNFLYPNAVLAARNLVMRKGFPESYDTERLLEVLDELASGAPSVRVPVYSHRTYDIDGSTTLEQPDVVILEGINALGEPGDACALRIYLDADPGDIEAWFTARFHQFVAAATDDPSSFFAQWATLGPAEVDQLAGFVWRSVNEPNLVTHIAPTRGRAHLILRKGPDHAVTQVAVRR